MRSKDGNNAAEPGKDYFAGIGRKHLAGQNGYVTAIGLAESWVSLPVAASRLKTTALLPSWLVTIIQVAVRIPVKISRRFAAGFRGADHGELERRRIDGEFRDAVVAAIGGVDEFAIRRDADFGTGAGALEIGGQRGDFLKRRERAFCGIPVEGGDHAAHFVEHVHDFAVQGWKIGWRGAAAGFDGGEGRITLGA